MATFFVLLLSLFDEGKREPDVIRWWKQSMSEWKMARGIKKYNESIW